MRAIVLGAGGLVGRHIMRELKVRGEVYPSSSYPRSLGLDYVFNAIGFTDIERAESEPEEAFYANEECAATAAEIANSADAVLVHVSTEFVFDGNTDSCAFFENTIPIAKSVYARSKRAGEIAVEKVSQRHHIVRLQNLYGEGGMNLLSSLSRGIFEGVLLDDERAISPMWAGTAARIMCDIAESHHFGTWHVAVRDNTTYAGFAERFGVRRERVASTELPLRVPRPTITLACRHVEANGWAMPTWGESLTEMLKKEKVP